MKVAEPTSLAEGNAALLRLAMLRREGAVPLAEQLARVVEISARTLGVDRVGVWLTDASGQAMRCEDMYIAETDRHAGGDVLSRSEFPAYFEQLRGSRSLAVEDAVNDPRTRELAEPYLVPLGIRSLLDAPIYLREELRGVVCHEQLGEVRPWSEAERIFAGSIADFVALALADRDNREREHALKAMAETSPQAILMLDASTRVLRVNRQASTLLAATDADLVGSPVARWFPDLVRGGLKQVMEGDAGTVVRLHGQQNAVDAHERPVPVQLSLSRVGEGERASVLVHALDLRPGLAMTRALDENEAIYRAVVHDQPGYIMRADGDGIIVFANEAIIQEVGAELLSGSATAFDFVPADERHVLRDALERLEPDQPVVHYEHHVIIGEGPDKLVAWTLRAFFEDDGSVRGYQAIGQDVTTRRQQEERMRAAQRLESLAVLAGGVAHDFNNLLTPILVYADLALTEVGEEGKLADELRGILLAAGRARRLVAQLLQFSRTEPGAPPAPVPASPLLRETLQFIRAAAPASVDIRLDIDTDCGAVVAHPTDLYQITSNLCTNAVQAMPAGGQLWVSASLLAGEEQLQLVVRDTGSGIPHAIQQRVFEPFFTTKAAGQGTGLGLSVVRGLVERLGGTIELHSEPGHGTNVVVRLPATCTADAQDASGPVLHEPSAVQGHGARVLVVDDQPEVAAVVREGLAPLGFDVATRLSANEALVEVQGRPGAYDLAVIDHTMPRLTGVELARRLRVLAPHLRIVLISGFGNVYSASELRAAGVGASVAKPFTIAHLARVVRRVLDGEELGPVAPGS